jgi:phosphoglycerate dehydrogenase-like enzyme
MTFWSKPGPIERSSLLDQIADKDALFCLLTDKIDLEVIGKAQKLKILG